NRQPTAAGRPTWCSASQGRTGCAGLPATVRCLRRPTSRSPSRSKACPLLFARYERLGGEQFDRRRRVSRREKSIDPFQIDFGSWLEDVLDVVCPFSDELAILGQIVCPVQDVAIGDASVAAVERHSPQRDPCRTSRQAHVRKSQIALEVVGPGRI